MAPGRRSELREAVVGVRQPTRIHCRAGSRACPDPAKARCIRAAADRVVADAPPRRLAGPIFFSASITPERALAFSRAATDGFAALAANHVPAEELASAKAGLASERAAQSIGDQVREIEMYQLPRTYPLNYRSRLEAVTAADVQRVVRAPCQPCSTVALCWGPVAENLKPSDVNRHATIAENMLRSRARLRAMFARLRRATTAESFSNQYHKRAPLCRQQLQDLLTRPGIAGPRCGLWHCDMTLGLAKQFSGSMRLLPTELVIGRTRSRRVPHHGTWPSLRDAFNCPFRRDTSTRTMPSDW